jgi:hypothetical protein
MDGGLEEDQARVAARLAATIQGVALALACVPSGEAPDAAAAIATIAGS